ncbi:uncharacterized protein LOC133365935 isoform X2 [Rhineura floridana]|uniref:uncharacterized protein LOC133365935 isoform X2 n=1 Tax=Rhineura floridana TaxID=261503 RepID=UPI002AC80C4C|nr:uncharacterized protein LOC133365935 isoform X2 [Rhineura floridana]
MEAPSSWDGALRPARPGRLPAVPPSLCPPCRAAPAGVSCPAVLVLRLGLSPPGLLLLAGGRARPPLDGLASSSSSSSSSSWSCAVSSSPSSLSSCPGASWLAVAARRRPPPSPAPAMGRRRRAREPPARLVLLALALASGSALLLASLSLLLAAWPRSSARAVQQEAAAPAAAMPQELLSEDGAEELDPVLLSTGWSNQGKFLHHFAQQGALRQRRQAAKGKRSRPRRTSTVSAAHYEVQPTEGRAGIQADANGTIRGWAEAKLNTTSPLRYDSSRGEFTVVKRGLYYLYCQSAGHLLERPPPYTHLERRIRDAGRNSQKPQCQRNIEFATEVWWKPFLQLGRALELSGRDVLVKHTGLYFIYSQVLFHDPTFTMGQLLRRLAPGRPEQILFRCVQSMPQTPVKAYNSCYSGGIFHLQHGDRLNLRIPRFNASFDISDHGTFLGLLRL